MATLLPTDHDINQGQNTYTIDPTVGGLNGIMPDYANWAQATNLVRPRLIAVVMQEPTGMQYMDSGDDRISFLKAMIEVLPKSITGLDRGRTVSFLETPAGNNGDMMERPTQTLRNRSVPNFTWDELEGKLITNMLDDWIADLMMNSELGHPGIIARDAYIDADSPAITADFQSAVVMFYEPNREMTGINSAYMCANFMPKSYTDQSQRVVGEALVGLEQTSEFTAYTMDNGTVLTYAQNHLDDISKDGLVPRQLEAFSTDRSVNLADDAVEVGATYIASEVAASL